MWIGKSNQLTSLEGSPKTINGNFICSQNPNEHLNIEYKLRKENPDLSDDEIFAKMIELGYIEYLPKDVQDIFVF